MKSPMSKPKRRDGAPSRGGSDPTIETPSRRPVGAAPKPVRKTWRARVLALVFGLFAAVAMVAVLEVMLRVFSYGHPTAWLVRHSNGRGWTVNDRFHKRFYPGWGAGNSRPFFVPDATASNTIRIFILGESAALGTPNPAFGFARMLGVMLRVEYPDAHFEILNAAMRGINSHVILPIAEDCARREPDLFIVYMGNNELVGLHGVAADSTFADRHLAWSRTLDTLKGTRVGQLALSAKRKPEGSQDMEFFHRNRCGADDSKREPAYQNFAANLGGICDAIRDARARALLLTVGSNLKDFPPLASLHKPGLSADALASWDAAYAAGATAEAAGRFDEALTSYDAAARIDDRFADLSYRLGRCHLALGQLEPARRHFVDARDRDALPFRADGRLNEIIRATAADRGKDGVTLLDIEKHLGQLASAESAPGERFFLDHVHYRLAGDYEVARALLPAVVAGLGGRLGKPRGGPPLTVEACAAALGYNAWEEWQIDSAVLLQTSKPPFLDQIDHRLRQLRTERELKDRAVAFAGADLQRAREISRAAVAKDPGDWQLRQNLGSMSLLTGDYPEAVTHLQQVVATFPDWIPSRMMLGSALLKAQRFPEATDQFKACLRVESRFEPARQALAGIQGSPR